MRQHNRMLQRIASHRPYHPHFGRRFDKLVVARKSWGYWFIARVAGLRPRVYLPPPPNDAFMRALRQPYDDTILRIAKRHLS